MPVSRRSLLTGMGSALAIPAFGAAAPVSTAKWGIWSVTITAVQISLHGFYPKDGSPLPAKFDLSLDGGATWPYGTGFAHDNGAWDAWIYNVKIAPGTYHVVMRDSADHAIVAVAPSPAVLHPNTAPSAIQFTPIKFSTSLPTGSLIGVITATGGTPQLPLTLAAAAENSPGYAIAPLGGGKWRVSIADQGRLAAGENRLAGRIASGKMAKPFSFTFPVARGHVVPAEAMMFRQAPGLTNATAIGSPAFRVGMKGYAGGTFSILSQAAPADPGSNMRARYTLTGETGTTSNTLSAQDERIQLSWTDGVHTCVAEHVIKIGSVLNTGPVVHVANQGALGAKMARVQNNPLGRYKGAVIVVAPGPYNAGWLLPHALDGWNNNGFLGPQTIKGAPGVMPVMEQTGAWINNGKGWLESWGWDLEIIGLEFANLFQSNPGEIGNFAGIKLNAGVLGKTLIRFVYAHNCTNGVLGGEPGQIVTIADCEFAKNGGGDGFTHNFYLAAVSEATVQRVVSWGANVGHCGKIRAAKGHVSDSVFADGPFGCASYLLDLPDGGVHVVKNVIFEKGPHAQNGPLLRYGEECQNQHPVNTLLVEDCVFINHVGKNDRLYNDSLVYPVAIQVGLASGHKARALVRNCKFYGFTKQQATHSDGPNARIALGGGNQFLPLSEAPESSAYMSRPFAAGGYASATGAPAPYHTGPMKGH